MTERCSRHPFCDETADLVVPAPDGSDYPICQDCYDEPCGRCRSPIDDDSNVAKGLCQDCRDEIRMWSGDEDRGVEKDPDQEQTTLLTDGGYVGPCWDCGDEYPVAKMSEHRVHDWDTDGPGYETYRAPLCPSCSRKRQPRYPCQECGREWPDVEGAATCCPSPRDGRPMPDGGSEREISLPGGGPECPGCGGPSYLVTDSPRDGERPWWCPDCNVRLDGDGNYGSQANFPVGSKPGPTNADDDRAGGGR